MQDIEAHREADERWRENRKLGKIIEDLIQKRLKSLLLFSRIRLNVIEYARLRLSGAGRRPTCPRLK
ncbi:hypothetical protein J4G48_0006015 [Bradyrhizobium barranii subsp. apii]|uniref:hypothetical protein n=1 Tax=Bradyrhizobium barranii TaxID=2992140 RepID=UPI001AA0E4CF|nr:hypothetical protein [Bradyrhizobium barranii]UPT97664.1 hypothetical protein J4G48_0006015 [Bradyrhizobium barranii subsp. apii]